MTNVVPEEAEFAEQLTDVVGELPAGVIPVDDGIEFDMSSIRVGLNIKCTYDKKERAKQKAFSMLQNENGECVIKVDECGCSLKFVDEDDFPSKNMKCLCKRQGHLLVKYTIL